MSATLDRIDIRAALAEQAAVVEQAIDTLLPLPDGHELRLVEAMRYATLGGGKRLRGLRVQQVGTGRRAQHGRRGARRPGQSRGRI